MVGFYCSILRAPHPCWKNLRLDFLSHLVHVTDRNRGIPLGSYV
jgi:hypothetical protein